MQDGLVTIVLPIYNVEKYLDRCINSIVNQTYKRLEIILVDDGSTDKSPQKCEEWAKKDERIKVIHKINAGLGCARNTGIEHAAGEYICFFDSDDYIERTTIEKVYGLINREKADIAVFGFTTVDKNGKVTEKIIPNTASTIYKGEDVVMEFLPNLISWNPDTGEATNLRMSAWSAMYSMNLIRKNLWCFVSERDIISEDVYSLLDLYQKVKTVVVIPEPFYFYCENEQSLTHSYRSDRYERIRRFYLACIYKCDQLGYGQEIKSRMVYPFISNSIAAMKMIVESDLQNDEKKKALRDIVHDQIMQDVVHKINLRNEPITRRIFFFAIKNRMDRTCFLLVKAKLKR